MLGALNHHLEGPAGLGLGFQKFLMGLGGLVLKGLQ
jgi:hypothetical protein